MLMFLKQTFVLMLDMGAYLFYKLVVAPQNQARYLGCRINGNDRLNERAAQPWQTEIEKIGMRVMQVSLQRRNINICRKSALLEYLIIDYRQECRSMYVVCLAGLLNGLFTHTHLQPETADYLYRIFLLRHQITDLI